MNNITCNHCSRDYDDQLDQCPNCRTRNPLIADQNLAEAKKKFIIFFIGVVVFCGIMILWLPRG